MKLIMLVLAKAFFLFSINAQQRNDIIIQEIMPDPLPQVGMPNYEWIEIYNRSQVAVDLRSWRLIDAAGQSGPFPYYILKPDSFLVICHNNAVSALSVYGPVIGVGSFPGLDNDGEVLYLKNAQGETMHAVHYKNTWYKNALKKEGGWSLEMIDTNHPCTGYDNWVASLHSSGATPGNQNSNRRANADTLSPEITNTVLFDSSSIQIQFNETLDSAVAVFLNHYSIDGTIGIISCHCVGPLFNEVRLQLTDSLESGKIYNLTVSNVKDCSQNTLKPSQVKIGRPVNTNPGDVIINELLFNPRSNAYDYIELFNKSDKVVDLSRLFVANRSNGNIGAIKNISSSKRYFYPGDYIVLTEDALNLTQHYLIKSPDDILELSSMPSLPDDAGNVLVLDFFGEVVDELAYKDDWHFKLISEDEGVALERIDPLAVTQNENNWHSAASSAGYGTPGYLNSQHKQANEPAALIEVEPTIISPDNDGRDDRAFIRYKLPEPGYVANIYLFNVAGKLVRRVVNNGIMAVSGYWTWDGLDENGNQLPVGIYIFFTEIFNLQGKKARFKNSIVVAKP